MNTNKLTVSEQGTLDNLVSKILFKGIEGLTDEEREKRKILLNKKYGEG